MVLSTGHSATLAALDRPNKSASLAPIDDHAGTHAHIFTPPRMCLARKGAKKCSSLPQPLVYPLRRCAAQQHMASEGAQVDLREYGVLIVGDALKERLAQKMATLELMQRLELSGSDAAEASALTPSKKSRSRISKLSIQAPCSVASSTILENTTSANSTNSLYVAKLEWSALTENRDVSPTDATSFAFAAVFPAEAVKETWKQLRAELKLTKSSRIYNPNPGLRKSPIRARNALTTKRQSLYSC